MTGVEYHRTILLQCIRGGTTVSHDCHLIALLNYPMNSSTHWLIAFFSAIHYIIDFIAVHVHVPPLIVYGHGMVGGALGQGTCTCTLQ